MRVRIFLKQPFFTVAGYIPRAAVVVEGVVEEEKALGLLVRAETWADEQGRPLEGSAQRIVIPNGKIDHVLVLGV